MSKVSKMVKVDDYNWVSKPRLKRVVLDLKEPAYCWTCTDEETGIVAYSPTPIDAWDTWKACRRHDLELDRLRGRL